MNVLFLDFSNVMDIKDSFNIKTDGLTFKTIDQADPDKVFKVFKFAIENKLSIVSISTLNDFNISMVNCLYRALLKSQKIEHKEFIESVTELKTKVREWKRLTDSDSNKGKFLKIYHFLKNNDVENYVIFDDKKINIPNHQQMDNSNKIIYTRDMKIAEDILKKQILINGSKRLQDSDIEKAKIILNIK